MATTVSQTKLPEIPEDFKKVKVKRSYDSISLYDVIQFLDMISTTTTDCNDLIEMLGIKAKIDPKRAAFFFGWWSGYRGKAYGI